MKFEEWPPVALAERHEDDGEFGGFIFVLRGYVHMCSNTKPADIVERGARAEGAAYRPQFTVLKGHDLQFFASEADAEDISNVRSTVDMRVVSEVQADMEQGLPPYAIVLLTPVHRFTLIAPNKTEHDMWTKQLSGTSGFYEYE